MKLGDFELTLSSNDLDTSNLRIHRLRVDEHISKLWEMELEVVSLGAARLDVDAASGAELVTMVMVGDEERRRFTGMITRIVELPVHAENEEQQHAVYRLEVRPRAWMSTLVETLDIFLDSTVPEVIEKKLALFDMQPGGDFELALSYAYPRREMIVQYRETDLAFLSRLCEHLGIYFYFAHADADRMVFSDDTSGYRPIGDPAEVAHAARGDSTGVYELTTERNLIPVNYVCRDYNDRTPALELQQQHQLDEGYGGGIIEYGGDFLTPADGDRLALVRAEERLCTREIHHGMCDDPRFAAGHTFRLDGHPRHEGELLLVSVVHEASQQVAGWGEGSEQSYSNRFQAIAAQLGYRPPRVTPIPRVHGLVSGVIETHQAALEKYAKIDEHGRYLVRFLFDTAAPGERKASCRVRMMQALAGPSYGVHFPLKPGTEVTIAFLDGNPDRPIILGAVPNPITPTPVNAAISTKSRIKTRAGIVIEFEDADRG